MKKRALPIISLVLSSALIIAVIVVGCIERWGTVTRILTFVTLGSVFLMLVITCVMGLVFSRKKAVAMERMRLNLSLASEGRYRPTGLDGDTEKRVESLAMAVRGMDGKNRKMAYVLDAISQSIIALDANEVVKLMNLSAREFFGRDESVIGRDLYFAIPDREFREKTVSAIKNRESFEYRRGDRYYAVDAIRTDEYGYGEITDIIIITDVSAKRLAARQRSDFFSNAGHELKTPLTSVMGNTELLLQVTDDGSQARTYAERIHREVTRLGTLINDMLKLSRIENLAGSEDNQRIPVSLESVVSEIFASLAPAAEKKGITLSLSGSATVLAEPRNAYEIVGNLCSNAVSYNTDGGSVCVTLSEDENTVTLAVADTGIGIAAKHIPRLCERFYRVDKSRSKITGGTGLGLAIVKHVCVLYGATLDIQSQEGVGTTVTVVFKK